MESRSARILNAKMREIAQRRPASLSARSRILLLNPIFFRFLLLATTIVIFAPRVIGISRYLFDSSNIPNSWVEGLSGRNIFSGTSGLKLSGIVRTMPQNRFGNMEPPAKFNIRGTFPTNNDKAVNKNKLNVDNSLCSSLRRMLLDDPQVRLDPTIGVRGIFPHRTYVRLPRQVPREEKNSEDKNEAKQEERDDSEVNKEKLSFPRLRIFGDWDYFMPGMTGDYDDYDDDDDDDDDDYDSDYGSFY